MAITGYHLTDELREQLAARRLPTERARIDTLVALGVVTYEMTAAERDLARMKDRAITWRATSTLATGGATGLDGYYVNVRDVPWRFAHGAMVDHIAALLETAIHTPAGDDARDYERMLTELQALVQRPRSWAAHDPRNPDIYYQLAVHTEPLDLDAITGDAP